MNGVTVDWVPDHEEATVGTLCIRDDWDLTDRPVIFRSWWRIRNNVRRSDCEAWIGQAVDRTGPGLYTWYGGAHPLTFRLENGGSTVAFRSEEIPIPPPPARVEVRWNWGRWEKFLKSKGWVAA